MPIQLIAALLIAAGGFGSAWQIQSWRYDAKEKARVEQILVDQRLSAAVSIRRADNVIAAQNAAAGREVALRRDADGARTALVGLYAATDAALRNAATSQAACLDAAAALNDVLKQSTERYRSLGETCDRHVNDLKTLTSAWPKP